MLFATYIAPIAGVISSFGIHHTQYADDTQLYIELRNSDTLLRLNDCFRSVHSWFAENGLALNPDKSEVIVIGTGARNRKEDGISAVTLGDTSIAVSKTVESLGVTLDETRSFNSHVDNVCKAAHFHIRALRHIRRCIDDETARTVACSMVGARLDYCNSILYGTSAGNLGKIQRVINMLARVVSSARKRDHITPVLADLHWLPIASRIRFKVALQTYKTVTRKKPEYLADLLSFQTASRSLRSSSKNRLHVDVARTSFASRAFRHAAPSVWNALPVHLTDFSQSLNSFKKQLKTFLYNQAYRQWHPSPSAPAIQSIHILNMFSLTYGTSPAVYYYYYYYLMPCTSSSLSYMHPNPSISDLSFCSCKPGTCFSLSFLITDLMKSTKIQSPNLTPLINSLKSISNSFNISRFHKIIIILGCLVWRLTT